MEKRDLIIVAVGIIVVLIMAVFIKPMITGEQAQFFPSTNNTTIEENISQQEEENLSAENVSVNVSGFSGENSSSVTQELVPTILQSTPNATPTAVPTWDKTKKKMEIQSGTGTYVSPRAYPTSYPEDRKMLTYSSMSGNTSGITKPVSIPYGYWELQYTVSLSTDLTDTELEEDTLLIREKKDAFQHDIQAAKDKENTDDEEKVANVTSFSMIKPRFSITIRDASTGEVIRTVTPQGGLNPELWGVVDVNDEKDEDKENDEDEITYVDPRPWTEKFFSGGEFIFDIDSYFIDDYTILVRIPDPQTSTSAGAGYKKEKSDVLRGVFSSYQNLVNADVYQKTYIANITGALSSVAKKDYPASTTYNTLINDRLSGAAIDSFLVTDEWIQGNQGELTGSVVWRIHNNTITTPVTVPFSRDTNGKWFLDSPVYLTEDKLILLLMKEYQDAFNADYTSSSYAATISGLLTQGVREEYSLIQCDYGKEQGKCCSFKDPYCEPADQCCSTREDCSLKGIYRTVVSNRVQGITITDIIPYDTSSSGVDGSLKGEIIWDVKGVEKKTYDDIPVKKDDGWVWRLDTLITLRI